MTDTRQALAALLDNFERMLAGKPVRDAGESIAYARAALAAQPVAGAVAQQRFDEFVTPEEAEAMGPVERLRAFCSFAMNGQDWIDVEPYFDALAALHAQAAPAPEPLTPAQIAADVAAERARTAPAPSAQGEPVAWRDEAAKWLRRKANDARPAAERTGFGNPDWWRPAILDGAADELDAEQESAPLGLDYPEPIVNKFGDTLRPEVQRFMEESAANLIAKRAYAPFTPPPAVVNVVPLTDEQIGKIAAEFWTRDPFRFTRAIERAHGIAPKAAQPVEGER